MLLCRNCLGDFVQAKTNKQMKLLLHICCAVCACALVEKFRKEGISVEGYFYNPNIHPYLEFKKRLRAVEVLAEQDKLKVYYERDYGLKDYLKKVIGNEEQSACLTASPLASRRCDLCYEIRLRKTAEFARQQGFDRFSSTLIISPWQKQERIKTIGEKAGQEFGVNFYHESVTELYDLTREIAKKRNLYRQQYCGCIFSEYERYHKSDE